MSKQMVADGISPNPIRTLINDWEYSRMTERMWAEEFLPPTSDLAQTEEKARTFQARVNIRVFFARMLWYLLWLILFLESLFGALQPPHVVVWALALVVVPPIFYFGDNAIKTLWRWRIEEKLEEKYPEEGAAFWEFARAVSKGRKHWAASPE